MRSDCMIRYGYKVIHCSLGNYRGLITAQLLDALQNGILGGVWNVSSGQKVTS